MIALLALTLLATTDSPLRDFRIREAVRLGGRGSMPLGGRSTGPLFRFADASGVGMGAAGACTAVTGTKGEPVTFTRASISYCNKSHAYTLIANGDLVECAVDQPCVGPGGDGTGPLGLLVEGAVTNLALRSQEFDNGAVWIGLANIVAAPTVTANAGVAPDGTTTAERLQAPAIAGAESSVIYQAGLTTGSTSKSLYVRGYSGSGALQICQDGGTCQNCAYVSTSWERCVLGVASGSQYMYIGNLTGTPRAAIDALIWQADVQGTAFIGTAVKTAGTAATIAVENAVVTLSSGAAQRVSMSADVILPASAMVSSVVALWHGASQTDDYLKASFGSGNNLICNWRTAAANHSQQSTTAGNFLALNTTACSYDQTNRNNCLNGVCEQGSDPAITLPTYTTLTIGGLTAGAKLNGVIKNLCVDTTATGCP